MRKILIVRTCAIGNFVLNLPALIALQKRYADARFVLVGNLASLEVAVDLVTVESIRSIDAQPWARLFYEPMPDLEFDAAVVWMKDPVVANNLSASGIPNVIRANAFPTIGHAADHLLRTLSLSRPKLPDLWNPTSSEILLHPGSASPKKNWPFFEELMHRLPASRMLPENLSIVE